MLIKLFVIVVAMALVCGIWFWMTLRQETDDTPASIVLLLKSPKSLSLTELTDLFQQEVGASSKIRAIPPGGASGLIDDHRPVGDMVSGDSPHFIAQIRGTTFAIHNLAVPYMPDPVKASETFAELRLRKAIGDHNAWLSVDIVPNSAATPEAYRLMARVLSHFVDSDCLALYHPPLSQFVPCSHNEVLQQLKSDDPITAVFRGGYNAAVIPVEDDPRLKEAEAEARRRYAEFETAFRDGAGTDFAVKTTISRAGNSEHIWLAVERISGTKIEGFLANEPVDLPGLKAGSPAKVDVGELEDWVYTRNGDSIGLFTLPVIRQIEEERSQGKAKRP